MWGLLPIYWKALHSVPAAAILANRIVWSAVFVTLLLSVQRHWNWLPAALRSRRTVLTYVGAGVLLSINWYIYIWAVNAGFLVDSSLGYFITPLINVLLGVLVFRERLRMTQWLAVGLATAGVLYITFTYGQLPWIGLSLALTFGVYGLVKKRARLPSLEGMTLETGAILLPALAFLIYQETTGAGVLGHVDWWTTLLLVGTGVITVIPLLWFAEAAQRIPLSMLGLIQYIAPTLMFLIGLEMSMTGGSPRVTVSVALSTADMPSSSVARTVKVYDPDAVGVPPTEMVFAVAPCNCKPGGNVPALRANVYGPVPPLAVSTCTGYGVPLVPLGKVPAMVIVGHAPVTVKVAVCTSGQLALLSVIGPVTAPVGTIAVICVAVMIGLTALTLPLNFTAVTPVKSVPVMTTGVPIAPLVGASPVTTAQSGKLLTSS